MAAEQTPAPQLAVSLDEVKAYLRIENGHEDALLAGLVRTATGLCEAFTGQVLIEREAIERVPASVEWRRLSLSPVRSINGVEDEAAISLPTDSYALDIDCDGDGWVRMTVASSARLAVRYRAGMASEWNGIAEPLRQGIVRLVAHMHLYRDDRGDLSPPAAVAALWRPWRRMRLA